MTEDILAQIRAVSDNLKSAILCPVEIDKTSRTVSVKIITDNTFTAEDRQAAEKIVRAFVPAYFKCAVTISKLSPDAEMVKRKILEAIDKNFKAAASTIMPDDVTVEKTRNGFEYTIGIMQAFVGGAGMCDFLTAHLKSCFCGEFYGKFVEISRGIDEIEIEEEPDEVEFELPVRYFPIRDFECLEGTQKQENAIYMSDLNLAGDEVVVCGEITDIRVRTYTNKKGQEKEYLSLVLNDTTATMYATYFIRQRTADKIKALRVGDFIVC